MDFLVWSSGNLDVVNEEGTLTFQLTENLIQRGLLALIQKARSGAGLGGCFIEGLHFPRPSWFCSSLQYSFNLRLASDVNHVDANGSQGYLVPRLHPGSRR